MQVLSRYLITRFLRAFATSLVVLSLTVLAVDMLLDLSEMLDSERDALGVLRVLALRFSALYLSFLLPIAAFTGAFFSVGSAARANEVVAMKAGGISPPRALLPLFGTALVIAAGALLLDELVAVRASAALHQGQGGEAASGISLRSGTIWYHTGRFVYNIREPDSERDTLRDVRVFERDLAGRLIRLIEAESARRLAPHRWSFEQAVVRRFDPARPDQAPQEERAAAIELELAEERSPHLLQAEIAALPLPHLARYAFESRDARATAALHQRLSGPLLVVLFVLLAVPLALHAESTRTLALPALQGVVLLFLFISAREYGTSFASRQGPLPAMLAPWLVLGLFAAWGCWRMSRVPR